jgi:hypothetical protein
MAKTEAFVGETSSEGIGRGREKTFFTQMSLL